MNTQAQHSAILYVAAALLWFCGVAQDAEAVRQRAPRGLRLTRRLGSLSFRRGGLGILAGILLLFGSGSVRAEGSEAEEKVDVKAVTGQVVHVGKRAISVEYATTADGSFEMLLPVNQDTTFQHLKGLADLARGDTVKVQYRQTYTDTEKGERITRATVATNIALVRRVPQQAFDSRETDTE